VGEGKRKIKSPAGLHKFGRGRGDRGHVAYRASSYLEGKNYTHPSLRETTSEDQERAQKTTFRIKGGEGLEPSLSKRENEQQQKQKKQTGKPTHTRVETRPQGGRR